MKYQSRYVMAALLLTFLPACSAKQSLNKAAASGELSQSAVLAVDSSADAAAGNSADPGVVADPSPDANKDADKDVNNHPAPGYHADPKELHKEPEIKNEYAHNQPRPQDPKHCGSQPVPEPPKAYEPLREEPKRDEPRQNLACNYPEFPLEVKSPGQSECHGTAYSDKSAPGELASYEFSIYNPSNLTSGWVPGSLGLKGDRYITFQNVIISQDKKPGTVDLILNSYEPVQWRISGNVAAVRNVLVTGYHCATVAGVDPAQVSVDTYEQGKSRDLPISQNRAAGIRVYEGSCLPGRAFRIE